MFVNANMNMAVIHSKSIDNLFATNSPPPDSDLSSPHFLGSGWYCGTFGNWVDSNQYSSVSVQQRPIWGPANETCSISFFFSVVHSTTVSNTCVYRIPAKRSGAVMTASSYGYDLIVQYKHYNYYTFGTDHSSFWTIPCGKYFLILYPTS